MWLNAGYDLIHKVS